MTEPSIEEMMFYLINGKKWALYLSLITYSLIFGGILIISLLVKNYLFQFQYSTIFKIVLVVFLILVSYRLYTHNHGIKNKTPYYGGIHVAYYECTKCESLYGGIFGKGPTQKSITDKECIHSWNALTGDNFNEKYLESNTEGK